MAVGAPWLGASKAIRGLVTGEKFGMDAFLNDNEAITFSHRIGTTNLPNFSAPIKNVVALQLSIEECCVDLLL
jgi:hypothetical protein